jgi:YidC/Oxa1 family membrane protein insertase
MEKRVVAAIALSVAVLFLFQYYDQRRLAELEKLEPASPKPVAKAPVPPPPPGPPAVEASPAERTSSAEDTAASHQRLVVDGTLYRAVLDNQGALITGWVLKNYRAARGDPFEMIPPRREGDGQSLLGSLLFDDASLTALANSAHYQVEVQGSGGPQEELSPPVDVVMRLRRGSLAIEKRYHFENDNYLVDFAASFEKDGRPLAGRVLLGQDIGPETEHFLNPGIQLTAISNQAGKVVRESPPKDAKETRRVEGDIRWVGLEMLYFAVVAIPQRPLPAFEIQKVPVTTTGLEGKAVERDLVRVAVPKEGSAEFLMYVGPKLHSALGAVRRADLSGVIDFGWFSILVRPLLAALIWIDKYIHNFGWAIIVLTLFLTLALFPFRLKQMVSMKKMQVVQPKIKEIQEKYQRYKKTDPRRAQMNQEIMAVYKANNVNPLGGCLPLLLQMPLLFAFYRLLASSIELRQAPFIGWLTDLSAKDPYYILPIVMGLTMIISQRMTPMTPGADPTQAKVMMFMPVVFTVMFLNVSSGLNLYFLCSNIFSIAFQKIAERWVGDRRQQSKSRK